MKYESDLVLNELEISQSISKYHRQKKASEYWIRIYLTEAELNRINQQGGLKQFKKGGGDGEKKPSEIDCTLAILVSN